MAATLSLKGMACSPITARRGETTGSRMNFETVACELDEGSLIGLVQELCFDGRSLSEILLRAGHRVEIVAISEGVRDELPESPQLLVIPIEAEDAECLRLIRSIRSSPRARAIPILGITSFEAMSLDLQTLRSHGVVGLVDSGSSSDQVLERVRMLVRHPGARRACERVGCFFPVMLEHEGKQAHEYALDLSTSGLRLTSQWALEENTDLKLHFSLPMIAEDEIQVACRLARKSTRLNSCGRYEVGVFFYPQAPRIREILGQEVARLLSGD